MGSRIDLHNELLTFIDTVYFQAPSSDRMSYPCIVYNKDDKLIQRANNDVYLNKQGYRVLIIERNPDSTVDDDVIEHFQYCSIDQHYVVDNLHHTALTLFY